MTMDVFENIPVAWPRRLRFAILPLLGMVLAALNGCVSKDAATDIKNFSNAVALTTSNSASAYQLVEQEHFDAQFSEYLLNYKGSLFKPAFSNFLTPDEMKLRLDVLDGLKTYGARLSALMGNSLTNLDQDTTKLGKNLGSVNQDLVKDSFVKVTPISSNDVQIFTAAVNALGHWLIALKAQKACQEAITNMQTHLPAICDVFEKDLDVIRNQVANDFGEAQRNSALYLTTNYNKLEPFQVRAELHRLTTLDAAKKKADDALAGTKASVEKLAAAHQALDQAFTKETNGLASLISFVSTEGQRVSSYYNSLQTNK